MNSQKEVTCIDCGQVVSFDQVKYGNPKCPQNIGASGVQYGHRVPREVYEECDKQTD